MTATITAIPLPLPNINKEIVSTYDWEDQVEIFDSKNYCIRKIKICEISIYDHLLIIDNCKYQIVHMLSK